MELKEYSENIKLNLDIEQVNELLFSLGADPVLHGEMIMCRTICHGGDSHKLYYYNNTHLFRCYTECSEIFDIFELIVKIKKQEGIEISLPQAVKFIANYFNLPSNESFPEDQQELQDWKILNKYDHSSSQEKEEKIIEMKFYDDKILKYLPRPRIIGWENEGILRDIMNYCGICYDPVLQGIVIPHYDLNGKLVGIRERTLIKENEDNGKYKPAILNGKQYNHPLGFTLYGLNWARENIKSIGKVIVFEGEKSVLLYQSYFGKENSIAVAACGSSLTKYQIELLRDCGAKEIIIAFDKQWKELGDNEFKGWTKKLTDINKKYGNLVRITYMFDKWGYLGYKDSPIDCGKETFLELFKRRFDINGK